MKRTRKSANGRRQGLRGPVLTLLSGSAVAFLVGYVAKLVLLRLYDPADFGLYEFIIAIVGVILPVSSLRYEDAVVLPESDDEARNVLGAAALVGAASVLMSLALIPLSGAVARLVGEPGVAAWIWTVPAILAAMRLSRLGELWLMRRERFGRVSVANVTQSVTMTAVRIAAGVRAAGAGGLLAGFGIGHGIAALVNGSAALLDVVRIPGRASLAGIRRAMRRYRRFAVYSAPATLVAALATRLPFLLLLFYFDREVLGHFGQAFNVLYVPLALVAAAVGQVFFVRAADAVKRETLPALAAGVHRRLVLIAFLPVVSVAAAGPDVFEVLFGPVWREAGEYAGWIGAWILFTSIASPLTRLFDVLERQRADLVVNAVMLAVVTAALVVGAASGSVRTALVTVGAAGAIVRIGQIVVSLRLAGLRYADILAPYLRHGRVAIAAGAVLLLVRLAGLPLLTTGAFFLVLAAFGVHTARREGLIPWALP